MDLISLLPESIVHRILSSLDSSDYNFRPPVDLVRMSVLSKTWFHLTASFPDLVFKSYDFKSQQSFIKYVGYSMSRFCHQNLTAQRLRISAIFQEPAEMDIVNRCLELLLKKGVKVLVVEIIDLPTLQEPRYRLPGILLSVTVLESLTIRGCELPSSLMVDGLKFKSLNKLILIDVPIDDEGIRYLTPSCPFLQELKILRCYGFKTLCVYKHQNLQQVQIEYKTSVERIDIEAPNLSELTVVDIDNKGVPHMNVASCKKLTTVSYNGRWSPLPNDFLSNFPFIEKLHLVTSDNTCNNLKWSNHSLRTLVLESDCNLEEVEFDTPILDLFIYGSAWEMVNDKCWPLLRKSANMKSCMQCYPDSYLDALWFQKLRLFLDKKNGFKALNLYIHGRYSREVKELDELYKMKFTELEELNNIELPPYELQYVELELDTYADSSAHMDIMDAVLWCCSPQHLTLRSFFPITDFEDVVKFVCKKLLQQEDQGHTNIQIVSCPNGKTISFIKEVVKEEA
ncbi:hypothetical protein SSX86_010041 [Deinandra increscens subsp. villosa]|uniref:F-box/LRR-repeat protein 15/At3g58940/PEG3-like LRR domain-containing protein n=1 Tax=Deinandra increscens subsp. villosa TaxID=3103831 RepID=A0AAP0H4L8_9ASTR